MTKKTDAPKTEAATEEVAKPKTTRTNFASVYPDDATLIVLSDANPKRAGSKSHERFEHYFGSDTVGAFRQAGGTYQDIAYDVGRGFVNVTVAAA